jgi:membrane protease YdiL (CAAX protease family)
MRTQFLERALGPQNQWWKYLVVAVGGFFIGQFLGSLPLTLVLWLGPLVRGETPLVDAGGYDIYTLIPSNNLRLVLMMLPTVGFLCCTIVLIRLLHGRSFTESINGRRRLRVGRLLSGALVWTIPLAVWLAIDLSLSPDAYVFRPDWSRFALLTALALVLVPLQTTSEELLFRGYLTQGVASWTGSRWMAVVLPALLFGGLHVMNPEVAEYGFWLSMPQYVFFGLLFGLVAVLDDGAELAVGMHTANNLFLSLFMTHEASTLRTDALFEVLKIDPARELVVLVVSGLAVLGYLSVRYRWDWGLLRRPVRAKSLPGAEEEID